MKRVLPFLVLLALVLALAPQRPASAGVTGSWLNLYNVATGKCIDIPGLDRGAINGAVNEFRCDYTSYDNQRFMLEPHGKQLDTFPLVLIKNKTDGLCLDLPGYGLVPDGTPVSEYRCSAAGDNQLFYMVQRVPGSYLLVNQATQRCLDVAGVRSGGNNARLTIWPCDDTDDHFWAPITTSKGIVSDAYSQTYTRAFNEHSSRIAEYNGKAPATAGDSLLVARFFIPNKYAAQGALAGDGRGYSVDPRAGARMIMSWDLVTDKVSFRIAPTTVRLPKFAGVYRARPIELLGSSQAVLDYAEVGPRKKNYLYVKSKKTKDYTSVSATVSAVNSFTSSFTGASWSVDGELVLTRLNDGRVNVSWHGNAYPAMEVFRYPRHSTRIDTLARRDVQPHAFTKKELAQDVAGGTAAVDGRSFARCSLTKSRRTMHCVEESSWKEHVPSWDTTW